MYNWYKIPTPSEISYQFRQPCFDIESWGGQSVFRAQIFKQFHLLCLFLNFSLPFIKGMQTKPNSKV